MMVAPGPNLVVMRGLAGETKPGVAIQAIRVKLLGVVAAGDIVIHQQGKWCTGWLSVQFPSPEAAEAGARALHHLHIGRRYLEVVSAPGWHRGAAGLGNGAAGGAGLPPPPGLPSPLALEDGRPRASRPRKGASAADCGARAHEPERGGGDGHRRVGLAAPRDGGDERLGPGTNRPAGGRGSRGDAPSRRGARQLARLLADMEEAADTWQRRADAFEEAAAAFVQYAHGRCRHRGSGPASDDSSSGSHSSDSSGDDEGRGD